MKPRWIAAAVLVAFLLSALTASAFTIVPRTRPAQWPMSGRDLQHSGRSLNVGSQTGTTEWTVTLGGNIQSSPVIGPDGSIYVGCDDKKVYSINRSNGSVKWSYLTGGTVYAASAVATDGTVYAWSDRVYALNAATGAVKWSRACGLWGNALVVGSDGTVYAGGTDGLFALNPGDGSVKWQSESPGFDAEVNSPAIGTDGTVYAVFSYCRVKAYNPVTGAIKWTSFAVPGGSEEDRAGAPSIGPDGTIYVPTSSVWDCRLYALKPGDGSLKWKTAKTGAAVGRPAIASDGTIYFGSSDHTFYAVNPSNGKFKWKRTTGEQIESSPAIGSDGKIYFGSNDNKVRALLPSTGSVKWYRDLGDDVYSPAIGSNGRLYVSAGHRLWSLDSHIPTKLTLSGKRRIGVGHMYTLGGSIAPKAVSGTVKVVWKRYYSGKYHTLKTATATIANGKFSRKYKPTKRGKWRVSVSFPGASTWTVTYKPAKTINKTFTVR
jgi:outer membrane protein assembly factor BamB